MKFYLYPEQKSASVTTSATKLTTTMKTTTTTTIREKAIQLAKSEDAFGAFEFLSNIQDPTAFVMMVSVEVGEVAHQWAWDLLEDWQNNEEPTWILPEEDDSDLAPMDYSDGGGM